jgi:hypothetical protein
LPFIILVLDGALGAEASAVVALTLTAGDAIFFAVALALPSVC